MKDIVFSESAAGGLKLAKSYGKGEYRQPHFFAVSVIGKNGKQPTEAEEERARQKAVEYEKRAWEQAVPISGKASDIYCLPLGLQTGDITELIPAEKRTQRLKFITADIPENEKEYREYIDKAAEDVAEKLDKIKNQIDKGKSVRIWYSQNPDEYLGFLWFCAWLENTENTRAEVYAVQLPLWADTPYGKVSYSGWGEVRHEYWYRVYNPVLLRREDIKIYANEWKRLAEENAPLRAVISGHIHSVPEDFYDSFIIKEIKKQPEEFIQAKVVGTVIGKYQLGINTGFIYQRMEKMLESGLLTAVTRPPPDRPLYHRTLKRNF